VAQEVTGDDYVPGRMEGAAIERSIDGVRILEDRDVLPVWVTAFDSLVGDIIPPSKWEGLNLPKGGPLD
jgi:hypothetical protein